MKSGLLLLNKPAEMTSFDCIRELKRATKRTDMGHGGTLDRFATGLLPIFFGEALKLARFFLEHHPKLPTYWKTYEGTMLLGTATETGDPEGAIVEEGQPPRLDSEQSLETVRKAMQSFIDAPYWQMPPKFSAKKIQGKRASDRVRSGEAVELKAVLAEIQIFECLKIQPAVDGKPPLITFRVRCSKGAYVRVLAQDLAAKLGTVAHLIALNRTQIGEFDIAQAVTIEDLLRSSKDAGDGLEKTMLSMNDAVSFLKPFPLMVNEKSLIENGQVAPVLARLSNSGLPADVYCAIENGSVPIALFDLDMQKHAHFIRSFRS